jgi:hypothetical protein
MRILHVCESYPPDYGGGAGVYAADICQGLARHGHEVRVLAVEASGGSDYSVRTDLQGGVSVRRVTLGAFATRDPEGWGLGLRGYRSMRSGSMPSSDPKSEPGRRTSSIFIRHAPSGSSRSSP